MRGWADTRCWGVAIVLGLALPAASVSGQSAPTSDKAPYTLAWSEHLTADSERLVRVNDLVVTASPSTGVEARAAADGRVAWKASLENIQAIDASAGGVFAVGAATVYAIDAASGAARWSSPIGAEVRALAATPAVVIVAGDREIRALRVLDGALAWRLPIASPPSTRISVDGVFGVVALADKALVAFEVTSGTRRWTFQLDAAALALTASRNRVYVGTPNAALCAFSQETGRISWRYLVGIPAVGDPVIDDRFVYLTQLDNTLKRYDAGNGQLIDSEALRSRPALGPSIAGAAIAVPLSAGAIAFISRSVPSQITRLTPSMAPRLDAVAVSLDGSSVVTLGILDGNRVLTAYRREEPKGP